MVKQYEIYWTNLNPTKGSETNRKRPCVIISPKEMNDNLYTLIVAPLTSTIRNFPTRVMVTINTKKGQIALNQNRSINKSRISNKVTTLNKESIENVKSVLMKMFK